MKEIKAIVQTFMLERVLDALAAIPELPGVTISEVLGWGRSRAPDPRHTIQAAGHAFGKKSKIEIVLADDDVDRVVDTLVRAARTGKPGDGKVFVHDVTAAVKVRTGERGVAAI